MANWRTPPLATNPITLTLLLHAALLPTIQFDILAAKEAPSVRSSVQQPTIATFIVSSVERNLLASLVGGLGLESCDTNMNETHTPPSAFDSLISPTLQPTEEDEESAPSLRPIYRSSAAHMGEVINSLLQNFPNQ